MTDTKKTLVYEDTPNLQRDAEPKTVQRFPNAAAEATESLAETANVESTETTQETDPAQSRKERAAAFKKAADIEARARNMQKIAEEKLQRAQHFEQIAQKFQQDPTSIAEVFGLSKEDFLRRYQNSILSIKDEPEAPPPDPQEEMKQRLTSLEQERQAEREQTAQMQWLMTKQNYINNNIMPIVGDKEKYKFLHRNGLEDSVSYLYDLMNEHFVRTNEELSINDVADVAETKLRELFFSKMQNLKDNGLLDEYIGVKEEAPAPQLGNKKGPSRTLSDSWGNSSPAPVQKQRQSFLSREERLAKAAHALEQIDKK